MTGCRETGGLGLTLTAPTASSRESRRGLLKPNSRHSRLRLNQWSKGTPTPPGQNLAQLPVLPLYLHLHILEGIGTDRIPTRLRSGR